MSRNPYHIPIPPKSYSFNANDPNIQKEILTMIIQYLEENNLNKSAQILRDESSFAVQQDCPTKDDAETVRKAVANEEWDLIETFDFKPLQSPRLAYAIYRHRFLKLLVCGDSHSALQFLSSRLRPYRAFEDIPGDFDKLCYLLVEATSLAGSSTPIDLNESLQRVYKCIDSEISQSNLSTDRTLQNGRLEHLIQQAAAQQYMKHSVGRVCTLIHDYSPALIPNSSAFSCLPHVHSGSVKALSFVPNSNFILSAGNDSSVILYDLSLIRLKKFQKDNSSPLMKTKSHDFTQETTLFIQKTRQYSNYGSNGNISEYTFNIPEASSSDSVSSPIPGNSDPVSEDVTKFQGHTGRVWALAASKDIAASAGGDGAVRVWDLKTRSSIGVYISDNGNSDVYSIDINHSGKNIISGGFDRFISLWDIKTGTALSSFKAHKGAVTSVQFDSSGNLAVSGSKDMSIKLWDLRQSICVLELAPVLGEVSCVSHDKSFVKILGAIKNNSTRIWDLRMPGTSLLLKGNQNNSKHFVRARFGPDDRTIISGSDDGMIYCWDAESGNIISKIYAHKNGVYDIVYSPNRKIFASCGEDPTILLWEMNNT